MRGECSRYLITYSFPYSLYPYLILFDPTIATMGKRERMEKQRVRKLESESATNDTSKSRRGRPNPESNNSKDEALVRMFLTHNQDLVLTVINRVRTLAVYIFQ